MKLPGRKVLDVLEQAVENTFTDDPAVRVGGMIQVSGLRFAYDPDRPKGERVRRVELTGGTWNPDAEYTVATNGMLLVLGAQGSAILDMVNAGWVWVIPVLLLLVALFLPPRLLFMTRALGLQSPPNFVLLAVFLVVLGIYATMMLYLI